MITCWKSFASQMFDFVKQEMTKLLQTRTLILKKLIYMFGNIFVDVSKVKNKFYFLMSVLEFRLISE